MDSEQRVDRRAERWREHRARRREELIDATIQALAEYGPTASMDDIARTAGVAKPKLYRYFNDKADLHNALGQRAAQSIQLQLVTVLDPTRTMRAAIHDALDAYLTFVADNPNLLRFLMNSNFGQQNWHASPMVANGRQIANLLVELITADMEPAHLDTSGVEPFAHAMVGAVSGATDWWLNSVPPQDSPRLSRQDMVDHLTAVVLGAAEGALLRLGVKVDPDQPIASPNLIKEQR